jgi:TatA/E family protein of Tat protein translocase
VLRSRRHPPRGGLVILSIGTGEILIIIALALVLFGPQRMVEISKTLGRATREVRRAMAEVRHEIEEAARGESSKREDR